MKDPYDEDSIKYFYKTKDGSFAEYSIGRNCDICQKSFSLFSPRDDRHICNECLRRLKKLLYPN